MNDEEPDQEFIRKLQVLKKHLDSIPFENNSKETLRRMMLASALSRLTGFRNRTRKENLAFLGKFLFVATLIVVFDLFSDLSTAILAAWSLFIVIDDYIGLRYLYFIKYQGTMEKSLKHMLARIKRLTLLSRLAHVFIWSSIILIAALTTTVWNTLLTALLALPVLAVVSWWTSRKWMDKMAEVSEMLEDIVDDPPSRRTMAVES